MSKNNIMNQKASAFSIRIVKLKKYLVERNESELARQILRSGTSIGANINEADFAQSRADFITKLHIALKEANETLYWLNILRESGCISMSLGDSFINDCTDIKNILIAALKTAKRNM